MKNVVWLVVLVGVIILAAILVDTLQGSDDYEVYKQENDSLTRVNTQLSEELLSLKIQREEVRYQKDSLLAVNTVLINENRRLRIQLHKMDAGHEVPLLKPTEAYNYLNIVYPTEQQKEFPFADNQVENLYKTHLDKNYFQNRSELLDVIVVQQDSVVDNLNRVTQELTNELTNCDQQQDVLQHQLDNKQHIIDNKNEEIKKRKIGGIIWKGVSAALLLLLIAT